MAWSRTWTSSPSSPPSQSLTTSSNLRNSGINIAPIKHIYTGFLTTTLTTLYAAILWKFTHKQSPYHNNQPSECEGVDDFPNPASINVWVISGPYILVGIARIFTHHPIWVHFHQAPKKVKSFIVAFPQFQLAFTTALNFTLSQCWLQVHLVLWFLYRHCCSYWVVVLFDFLQTWSPFSYFFPVGHGPCSMTNPHRSWSTHRCTTLCTIHDPWGMRMLYNPW